MGKEKRERSRGGSVLGALLGWILYIAVIIGLALLIITLQDGDQLIVDKISYRFKEPKRFDIIVFPYQYEENVFYIKRIIGLPGETVQVKEGYTYINGQKLESDVYGAEVMEGGGIAEEPIVLGKDEYFVLGDNRNHSSDSRDPSVGVLTRKDLLGRAWLRIYPFDHMGVIEHE